MSQATQETERHRPRTADPHPRTPPPAPPEPARTGLLEVLLALPLVLCVGCNIVMVWRLRVGGWSFFDFIRTGLAFNTLWAPLAFATAGAVGVFAARHGATSRRLGRVATAWIILAALMAGSGIWATRIEPNMLRVRAIAIDTPKLSAPVRLLHISDIQVDRVDGNEQRAFARMRELAPDLVLFTGDLIQPLPPATIESDLPKLERLLSGLTPPLGFFAVGGDVDGPIYDRLRAGLAGMTLLDSPEATVQTPGGRLLLRGLGLAQSRAWEPSGPDIARWIETADAAAFTILLGHGPDYVTAAGDYAIDLCLAGHTHGGQIRIPFYGPPVTFSDLPRRYARGLNKYGRTWLHVSAGLGGEHAGLIPTIRINCPPEMTLIELRPRVH